MKTVTPRRMKMILVGGYANIGCKIFEARVDSGRHQCHETILGYVQKAPDDTQLEID